MRKKVALFVVSLAVLLTAFAAAQILEKDTAPSGSGDFASALRAVRPLAERGDANAQYYLGSLYENGRGVRQNHAEAAKWYQRAAEQSHPEAIRRLDKLKVE